MEDALKKAIQTRVTNLFNRVVFQPRREFNRPIDGSGYHLGPAVVIENTFTKPDMTRHETRPDWSNGEIQSLEEATKKLKTLYQGMLENANKMPIEIADIFEDQMTIENQQAEQVAKGGLEFDKICNLIKEDGYSAEAAIYHYYQKRISKLKEKFPNEKDRPNEIKKALDYLQTFQTAILQYLQGDEPKSLALIPDSKRNQSPIPILRSLPVGGLIHLRNSDGKGTKVQALIRQMGVKGDHTSIIARGLRVIIANMPKIFDQGIKNGNMVIIDANNNKIIVNPSDKEISRYQKLFKAREVENSILTGRSAQIKHPFTNDGEEVRVGANIGFADEMHAVDAANATSVGLYRSEMAIIARKEDGETTETTKEHFFKIYDKILKASIHTKHRKDSNPERCASKTITMRTPDFEGDKNLKNTSDVEKRRLIAESMEAMLMAAKANPDAKINVMFPMINTPEEFEYMKSLLMDAGRRCNLNPEDIDAMGIHIGSMIETPEAVENIANIDADFYSVGSNDLIPLLLGYDRFDHKADKKYDPTNPHVLESLEQIIDNAPEGKKVSICGDMASDPAYTAVLIGLGFRNISSGAGNVPRQKEIIRRIDTAKAEDLVQDMMAQPNRKKREKMLEDFNREIGLHRNGELDMDKDRWPWAKPENDPLVPGPENLA